MPEQLEGSPNSQEMRLPQNYGECRLRDGGDNRRMLDIPLKMYENISATDKDRNNFDAINRLHQEAFNRSRIFWSRISDDNDDIRDNVLTIEVPIFATEEQIKQFVNLIEQNQRQASFKV
jgi:hypothetical protein